MDPETIHYEPQISDVVAGAAQQPMTYRQFAEWLISEHGFEHADLWVDDQEDDTDPSIYLAWLLGTEAEGQFPAWEGCPAFRRSSQGYGNWVVVEPSETTQEDRKIMAAVSAEWILYGYSDSATVKIAVNADGTRAARLIIGDSTKPYLTPAGWVNSL